MKLSTAAVFFIAAAWAPALAAGQATFDQKSGAGSLSGSVKAAETAVPAASPAAKGPGGPGLCVFNGATGAQLAGEAEFRSVAGGAGAVFAGETHDQLTDHLAQLEALKALAGVRGEKVAVGFEMLNLTLQPVLDEYASGALTEEEFLLKADWKKEWGFDFKLYKPLFDFIREKKLKAVALNLPKKVVSKIARVGLAGLTPEERQYLPAKVEITKNADYIKYMRQTYEGHGKSRAPGTYAKFLRDYILGPKARAGMGDFTFENYLAAMSAWNETMGSRLADFLNANPGYAGLAVAGSGHVIFNAGIPASVASRTSGLRLVSFYPQEAAACPAALPAGDAGLADYVWYLDHSRSKK